MPTSTTLKAVRALLAQLRIELILTLRRGESLLITLVVKLVATAALATMLVRYRRFRHILIFERRAWPDRGGVTSPPVGCANNARFPCNNGLVYLSPEHAATDSVD